MACEGARWGVWRHDYGDGLDRGRYSYLRGWFTRFVGISGGNDMWWWTEVEENMMSEGKTRVMTRFAEIFSPRKAVGQPGKARCMVLSQ